MKDFNWNALAAEAAAIEDEWGSFPVIGRAPKAKICDAPRMREIRVSCTRLTAEVPAPVTGRIYSLAALERLVELSNDLNKRSSCFVTLDYPSYGIATSDIAGVAYGFSVFRDRICATVKLYDTTRGKLIQEALDVDKHFYFMPYAYGLVGGGNRVDVDSLIVRAWYLEPIPPS